MLRRPGARLPDWTAAGARARLAAGDEVNVAGFGKFSVAAHAARQGRNPQTGETIQIAASNAPKFSAAGALKSPVNA